MADCKERYASPSFSTGAASLDCEFPMVPGGGGWGLEGGGGGESIVNCLTSARSFFMGVKPITGMGLRGEVATAEDG